jgi:hypothetical protein
MHWINTNRLSPGGGRHEAPDALDHFVDHVWIRAVDPLDGSVQYSSVGLTDLKAS